MGEPLKTAYLGSEVISNWETTTETTKESTTESKVAYLEVAQSSLRYFQLQILQTFLPPEDLLQVNHSNEPQSHTSDHPL